MDTVLHTERLELVPITVAMVEAFLHGRRADAEALVDARLPGQWPNRDLVERAFSADLVAIRANPDHRLWGDRVMVDRALRRVVGSVVFHGGPEGGPGGGPEVGTVEVAYGVERDAQGKGYATEGVRAQVAWALGQEGVRLVKATTFPIHRASRRVLEKCGFRQARVIEHDVFGEALEYECAAVARAEAVVPRAALDFPSHGW
ncbi:MAG: GNAT family N-acetyltransferase [Deltaproteobacteria bacterium]|nr:GNAT family N-acetyltransferase [Deltaproteobacteria bacterium]